MSDDPSLEAAGEDRFSELLVRFTENNLNEEEMAELNQELAGDETKRRLLVSICLQRRLLPRCLSEGLDDKTDHKSWRASSDGLASHPRRRRRLLVWITATSAASLLAVGVFLFHQRPRTDSDVTTQSVGEHSSVESGRVTVNGKLIQDIGDGSTIHVVGNERAVIHLNDGSRAEFEPGTSAVLRGGTTGSRQLIELNEGGGTFRVQKAKGEFQVATRIGRVTVMGTEFSVKLVSSNNQDESSKRVRRETMVVEVFAGRVQVESEGKTAVLTAGDSQVFAVAASLPVARTDHLPAAWKGAKTGSTDGNPFTINGKPVWRLDRVYPDKYTIAKNYAPMPWNGMKWHPENHEQGGQPSVVVENGNATISVGGPWTNYAYQKIAGVVFIVPNHGIYRIRATVHSQPWVGTAKTYRLAVLKKDMQRADEVKGFDLPRDGKRVEMDFTIELAAGNELVFLPLIPQWNNATNTMVEGLTIQEEPRQ